MFNVAWIFASRSFSVGLFLATPCKTASRKKIITKHNIQKTHIHSFHNRLLREATVILGLFLNISHSVRIDLEPTLQCVQKLHFTRVTILVCKQVRNNHETLILMELRRKIKQWSKKYEKYLFCIQSREAFYIKTVF